VYVLRRWLGRLVGNVAVFVVFRHIRWRTCG
jgi:hypothetical protein